MKMTAEQVARLSKAQNNPYNVCADIMTITAFFETEEQLEKHIKHHENLAEKFNRMPEKLKKKVLSGAVWLDEALKI